MMSPQVPMDSGGVRGNKRTGVSGGGQNVGVQLWGGPSIAFDSQFQMPCRLHSLRFYVCTPEQDDSWYHNKNDLIICKRNVQNPRL